MLSLFQILEEWWCRKFSLCTINSAGSYRLLKTGLYCVIKCHSILNILGQFVWNWYCGELACQFRKCKRCGFNPWVWKIPWRRAQQPTPVFLPGNSHGQRSLAGYNPWGCEKSDKTEATQHTCTQFCFLFKCLIVFIFEVTQAGICVWEQGQRQNF